MRFAFAGKTVRSIVLFHRSSYLGFPNDRSYYLAKMSTRRSNGVIPARTETAADAGGGRTAKGAKTRDAILAAAVDMASVEGLEGLTLGLLADRLNLSKSGLYAHFGSKEDLQLATFDRARDTFVEEAMRPAFSEPRGLPRLWGLVQSYLSYLDRGVFRGGCFISGAAAEFDAKSGPVHDAVAKAVADWRGSIKRAVEMAIEAGHLVPETDAAQLGYELCALLQGTNFQYEILGDQQVLTRCARSVCERLSNFTTESAPPIMRPFRERNRKSLGRL